jgi:tetratricopeptide (TPR) repeat protein
VLLKVYQARIQRGAEAFNSRQLGGAESELAVLPHFFASPWSKPLPHLSPDARSYVLSEAGAVLQASGRVAEAMVPLKAALDLDRRRSKWGDAATAAGNLGAAHLALGHLREALTYARQSGRWSAPEWADIPALVLDARVREADVLHQMGRRGAARRAFREAERWQQEVDPDHPLLYSTRGFAYCDFLLDDGRTVVVLERAPLMLKWADESPDLLDTALAHLTFGKALLMADPGGAVTRVGARPHLDQAIEGLRRSGRQDRLPPALIARADLRRVMGDPSRARDDLDEALTIAHRGLMALHQVDCHLALARTYVVAGEGYDLGQAQKHLELARQQCVACQYVRRQSDIEDLTSRVGRLRASTSFPEPPLDREANQCP